MDRQYVGIDFHRRRSVIVRLDGSGERLGLHRIVNDPFEFAGGDGAECGDAPEVVIEATYGWYWAVDLLQDLGATVHLANPKALNWGDRRVKNDERDATDLADMLRLNRLREAWIAPPAIPGAARAGPLPGQARPAPHRVEGAGACGDGQRGCAAGGGDMFGPAGTRQLDAMELARAVRASCPVVARADRASTTVRSRCSSATSTSISSVILAIGRCRRSTASARSARRSSSRRSVT